MRGAEVGGGSLGRVPFGLAGICPIKSGCGVRKGFMRVLISALFVLLMHPVWGEEVAGDDVSAALKAAGVEAKGGDFHGYGRLDFKLPGDGAGCVVVAPKKAAAGRPWIWRARFFGHEPALELELLERGYHVGYCDVGGLFGAPVALDRWDAFYAYATGKLGLHGKPVLEGMSRGGLPIFLWASRNPDKVSAIYGDNAVCDSRSWPGGNPGKGSAGDWKRVLEVYQVTEEEAQKLAQPVDEAVLKPIAAAGIPVALVLGMADDVVPPAANGEKLAANFEKLGGKVKIWRKPGAGHHPHGLHPPGPLREYLMKAVAGE